MEKFFNVFGNPIKHSLSPKINFLFSLETGINFSYGRVLVPLEKFEEFLKCFFKSGGLGANITLPFKERAFLLCDSWTDRSLASKTVNTIKKKEDGSLLGDNTDGVGLLYDLKRLCMIHKNDRVLLLGSGGASRSVIPSLLLYGCEIILVNRTFLRAKNLSNFYRDLGKIDVIPIEDLTSDLYFDLIINATSIGIHNNYVPFPINIIHSKVFCYDMFYHIGNNDTLFLSWCRKHGAINLANGIGMLVGQAAYSFFLWHNVFPSISLVLDKLEYDL
ncbi:MAG: shikimate dehydrogenase [Candidatus Westeberhardia cardiocondylae]|nr:shikimate dehydrogenase [Candidatus Westeberhardia cardiocondylae]